MENKSLRQHIPNVHQLQIINSKKGLSNVIEEVVDIEAQNISKRQINYKRFFLFIGIVAFFLFILLVTTRRSQEQPFFETGNYAGKLHNYTDLVRVLPVYRFESQSSSIKLDSYSAKALLIYNPVSYQILVKKNETARLPIGSLTKLMSAIIIRKNFDLNDIVTVGKFSYDLEWTLGLEEGDKVKVGDLLKAMLISSYNDAGFAIAEAYPQGGLQGFVSEMNQMSSELGLQDSHFANPVGYDDENNYSSAWDLKRIVYLFMQDDVLMDIVNTRESEITIEKNDGTIVSKKIKSTNYLLDGKYFKGLKTGYTKSAKQCFIAYVYGDDTDQLVVILLGSEDRFTETEKLLRDVQTLFR